MAKRERVSKQKSVAKKVEQVESKPPKKVDTEALKDEMDNLLDEIDSVLEQNAEEFVSSYIQKGGQLHGGFEPRTGGWCRMGTWNQKFNVPNASSSFPPLRAASEL